MADFAPWGDADLSARYEVRLTSPGIDFILSFQSAKHSPDEAIDDVVDRFLQSCLFDGEDDDTLRSGIRIVKVLSLKED